MSQTGQDSIVPCKEQWSYLIVNIANIPIMSLINFFLLIFYTDIAGLPATVVGTLSLVSKIFDGSNNPFMEYVVNHLPKTKMGRFHPYLVIGAILCSINYTILWLGPRYALKNDERINRAKKSIQTNY
jgi:Na+/melibiose symporter-like transporter